MLAARTTPKLVIFDCDGVLVDSEAISSAVLASSISAAGLSITPEETTARYQGLMLADIGADVEQRLGAPLPDDFWNRFDADRAVAFETSLRSVDGASETVTAIKAAGIRTCVASQARLVKTELTLGLTGLRHLFSDSELFSAYTVPRGKPFPDLFLHASRSLGVAPRDCVVVEDSASGIRAALAAEMRVIAYVAQGAPPPLSGATVPTIHHLTELIPLVVPGGIS